MVKLTEEELAVYEAMHKRTEAFIARFRDSPAYDFDTLEGAANRAAIELEDVIRLYASGGVDERGVEAVARLYVQACKRPEAPAPVKIESGQPCPPLPPPGTYPGKVQPGIAKELAKPPKIERQALEPKPEGEPEELDPDVWRVARLVKAYEHNPIGYFREVSLEPGHLGYAMYCPQSVARHPPDNWAVRFYSPTARTSYYLRAGYVIVYQAVEEQEELNKLWPKGFHPKN